ncbi:MAG: hypothetical protein EOP04_03540 [Proteobacteria bacterium]|nr:MAG: hypothetical protein EOP04_03540 [Pseudomonadota bacterium]
MIISYLGIDKSEVIASFEAALTLLDDRCNRVYETSYSPAANMKTKTQPMPSDAHPAWKELQGCEDSSYVKVNPADVIIDEDGKVQIEASSLTNACSILAEFLTDYIITGENVEEWLPLDCARAALLALIDSIPMIDEIEELTSVFSFKITRSPKTGLPTKVRVETISVNSSEHERISRSNQYYEGILSDETCLEEFCEEAKIPEREYLHVSAALSNAIFILSESKCSISFDVAKFKGGLTRGRTKKTLKLVNADSTD